MTNSIASSKCLPPVLTSGNYGMSQNRHSNESKEYIFVKLTDSAYRAIEEYQRNEHAKRFSNGQCPKIQLVGNSGVIHFPTPDNAEGRKFGFAIDDIEGSLECIQQTQDELDVLGALPLRMRIHANDDVYDTTRTKMAIAEETEKSKCIREIKPNQTDIGRKVKKPVTASSIFNGNGCYPRDVSSSNSNHATSSSSSNFLSNSNSRSKLVTLSNNLSPSNGNAAASNSNNGGAGGGSSSKHVNSSRSPNPTLLGGSTTTGNSHHATSNRYNSPHNNTSSHHYSNNNNNSNHISSSTLPSLNTVPSSHSSAGPHQTTHSSSCSNGYCSASSGSPPELNSKTGRMNLGGARSSVRSSVGGGGSGGNSFQSNKSAAGVGVNSKLPDISKRKLRERLVHLLALKPFKKPELYARLANEGLRDKDRLSISSTLKDIATLSRDNTYNLKRPLWNDVNENWPFYTEQELQQLKRRKPQNLTPPLSSDACSSTSGHSPTSLLTGSPPSLAGSGGGSLKRASLERDPYDEGISCGVQPKKQRISHFKKDSALTIAPGGAIGGRNGRLTYGNSSSTYGQHNNGQNSAVSYSPLSSGSMDHENSNNNNTDLSYNVLDNVDDFMPHVEHQSSGSNHINGVGSNGRRNAPVNNFKEKKRPPAGFNQQHERSSSKELMMKKKSSASPKTTTTASLYAGSFVAEKSSNSRGSSVNNYQRQSPNNNTNSYNQQQQHYKTNNSVIFSPKTQTQASPRDDLRSGGNHVNGSAVVHNNYNNCNGNSSNGNGVSGVSKRYQQHQTKSSRTSSQSRTPPTPPQHQQQQPTHYQPPHASSNHQHQAQQLQSHQQQQQQLQHPRSPSQRHPTQQPQPQSPQPQEQPQHEEQHSSPTQQIAAAASSYATAATTQPSQKHYDFSNYTPITSIEQRRQYKTEFENDYDEYRKLLAQIEGVSLRFRGLAERLENASKGCPDYYHIKQQIVSEYERIRNEEALQREKQRFDYLHEKLAHIKQLVTEYDKTLTSTSAVQQQQQQHAIMLQQQMQQQQQQQQKQQHHHHQQASIADSNDSCPQQALMVPQVNNGLGRNSRLSPMVGDNSPHYMPQQQQQQHQQHHAAETIQQSLQQQQQHTPQYNGHAPAQASPADTDTDDSSDSNGDDDDDEDENDDSNEVDSQDDDNVDDDDIDNEPY